GVALHGLARVQSDTYFLLGHPRRRRSGGGRARPRGGEDRLGSRRLRFDPGARYGARAARPRDGPAPTGRIRPRDRDDARRARPGHRGRADTGEGSSGGRGARAGGRRRLSGPRRGRPRRADDLESCPRAGRLPRADRAGGRPRRRNPRRRTGDESRVDLRQLTRGERAGASSREAAAHRATRHPDRRRLLGAPGLVQASRRSLRGGRGRRRGHLGPGAERPAALDARAGAGARGSRRLDRFGDRAAGRSRALRGAGRVMTLSLGYKLSSEEQSPLDLVRHAQMAEETGFGFGLISGHYHPWIDRQGQSPFVWSVLGAIAQTTRRLVVGTAVTCPTVRIHPAIVAQAAATTAALMPGRFFLGVGTGENLNEHILGVRWPETEVRQEPLTEAVEALRL